jgi:hypothetical protein
MTVTVKHSKTNAISDWTQAQLDEQIELGNFAPGTTLADIVLPSDWNNDHTLTGVGTMAEQDANNVAITGGTINGTTIGATIASTGKFTTLEVVNAGANAGLTLLRNTDSSTNSTRLFMDGSSGVTAIYNSANSIFFNTSATIGTTSGNNQFRVAPTSSAVNYVQVTGAVTTGAPAISAQGSDTNVSLSYISKGTGQHIFASNGTINNQQFRVSHTASAVNYVQVSGRATGNGPQITAQGSDTNINFEIQSKGVGNVRLFTGSGEQFRVIHTAGTIVNYAGATGSAAGSAPSFSVAGTDTNIDLALTPKGTGNVRFGTHTGVSDTAISGYITIKDSGGTTRKLAVIT